MTTDRATIYCGECLPIMADMPDNSVDLIATDPPYYRVKNEPWDRQWDKRAGFLEWIGKLCEQWQRLLKPNGSLYVFASPKMAAPVEVEVGRWFEVLNRITWRKHDGTYNEGGSWSRANKGQLRRFFVQKEEIIFAEHFGADSHAEGESGYGQECDKLRGFVFEPLRAYLDGERKRAAVDKADCNAACGFSRTPGGMASRHYFSRSQWRLPTAEHYAAMQRLFNASCNGSASQYLRRDHEDLKGEYEDLRREYEHLRREYEHLRRPFSVSADVPYTDVWDFPTVRAYRGKHPCEKPLAMMEHIIRASSREGAVVFDPFAGSGTTLVAARNLGRQAIGIEQSKRWCERTQERLNPQHGLAAGLPTPPQ